MKNEDSRGVEEAEKKRNDDVVVEMKDDNGGSRNGENSKSEILCRICHFLDEESSGDSQLITLGCDCRGELGVSHPSCAAAWFSQKGNRVCEICGKTAKNININNEGESAILIVDLNEMRQVIEALDGSNESSRRCKISFCNFLMLCLLVAFFLPWFFRGLDML